METEQSRKPHRVNLLAWAAGYEELWGCQPHIASASGDPRFGNIAPEGDIIVGKALVLTEQKPVALAPASGRETSQPPRGAIGRSLALSEPLEGPWRLQSSFLP